MLKRKIEGASCIGNKTPNLAAPRMTLIDGKVMWKRVCVLSRVLLRLKK